MPQNNIYLPFVNVATGYSVAALTDSNKVLATGSGLYSRLNITAATLVKTGAGRIAKVNVTTAGSTTGAVYDTTATGSIAAANLVAVIPNTVGSYSLDFPVTSGMVVVTGTGQVVSISYV